MDEETFRGEIASEIMQRWNGKFTEAMMSDWNYFMHAFTVDESLEHVRRFFRQYEQRGNPRPSEFGSWLKKNQIQTNRKGDVRRFNIDALNWSRPNKKDNEDRPEQKVTMFRMVDERFIFDPEDDPIIRFGWIERKPYAERAYVWMRRFGLWCLECLMPNQIKDAPISIKAIGEAPNSWTNVSSSKNPERLEELLKKEEW